MSANAGHEHVEGTTALYMKVWFALIGMTLLEVFLAYERLPLITMLIILMGLSVLKAGLIIAYFMHLKFERMSLVLTLIPTLVICICLLFIVFPDSFRANGLRTTRPTGVATEAPAHEESH